MIGVDTYTKLLLHCDGADGSNNFIDSSMFTKNVTANGNAQFDTAQFKFGLSSALFDGTGDFLTVPDSADWDFGLGQFTVDMWVRFASVGSVTSGFIGIGADGYFDLYRQTDANLYFLVGGMVICQAAWTPTQDTWYHLALVRESTGTNATKIYIDGTQVDTGTSTTNFAPVGILSIGERTFGDGRFNGWIDEVRVSNGIARWNANFTPPVDEYLPTGFSGFLNE